MKRYKGILLSSTLLIATAGFAAQPAPASKPAAAPTKGATAPTKGAVYKKAEPSNKAVPQWEPHVMGGIATLDDGDIDVDMTSVETDTLEQTNSGSWGAWTVTAGLGYIFPLHNAKVNSEHVQWFTAVQP